MNSKTVNEPLAPREEEAKISENLAFFRFGILKNGNPPGNPNTAPRCGANSKRTHQPCKQPAMANGRCRLHGGKSTGPKTTEGLERSRRANWKHGLSSAKAKQEHQELQSLLQEVKHLLKRF